MITYLKLDDLQSVPTAHAAGIKKVLSTGHIDFTRLTQIAWARLDSKEEIPVHRHPDMEESFFVTKGEGVILINQQPFQLTEGVFLVVPPMAEHFLRCTGECLEFFYFGLEVSL